MLHKKNKIKSSYLHYLHGLNGSLKVGGDGLLAEDVFASLRRCLDLVGVEL